MTGGDASRAPATEIRGARRVRAPRALATALTRRPPGPASLAGLLDGRSGAPAFRRMVAAIFPEGAATILGAEHPRFGRAGARVAAFLARIEAVHFPVYEFDEGWYDEEGDAYAAVLRGIAFVRLGWGYEQLHELDCRVGYRLLMALCTHPYAEDNSPLVALLESLAPLVPTNLLLRVPHGGLHPATLHARLDGGRFAAAADFGDWLWGGTDTAFLDFDDEVDLYDDDWTPENVALLSAQWRRANAILTRIEELATWLEGDPPARFAELLRAAVAPVEEHDATAGDEIAGSADPETARADGSTGRDLSSDRQPRGANDAGNPIDDADTEATGQSLPARRAA